MTVPASETKRQPKTIPIDPELVPGAHNAVHVCLRVKPSEKVTVITDEATREIAAAIVRELEVVGSPFQAWGLEDLAPRPVAGLPHAIVKDLAASRGKII